MKRLLALLLVLASTNILSMNQLDTLVPVESIDIRGPIQLGELKIYHDDNYFYVQRGNSIKRVEAHEVNRLLTDLLRKKLLDRLKSAGYIQVKEHQDGNYELAAKVRGNGGGPVLAGLFYWGTKTLCYGTALAGAGAAVVATGGAAGALTGAGVAAAGASASAGTTVVAGAIAGAGLTGEAALATASVVTSAGGITAAVAAVETAATAAGALGMAIPFL